MTMTSSDMLVHAMGLANAFKIHLVVDPLLDPRKSFSRHLSTGVDGPQRSGIVIAPVVDDKTYAAALHELGHCVDPLGHIDSSEFSDAYQTSLGQNISTLSDYRLILVMEDAAWKWAHAFALQWTPAMTQVEKWSKSTYNRRARELGLPGI